MQIAQVMTDGIEAISPDYTVEMAAQIMADLDREWLPVVEDNRLVGAITGREIAVRVEGRQAISRPNGLASIGSLREYWHVGRVQPAPADCRGKRPGETG